MSTSKDNMLLLPDTSTSTNLMSTTTIIIHPSTVEEHLVQINRIKEIHEDNHKLTTQLEKLAEEMEDQENIITSLREKIRMEQLEQKNLINDLKRRNQIIRKFGEQVEKRDRIFELCNNQHTQSQQDGDVNQEVFLNYSPGGHRQFEIRNKQQIPYWIKTEILSPINQEGLVDVTEPTSTKGKWDDDEEEEEEGEVTGDEDLEIHQSVNPETSYKIKEARVSSSQSPFSNKSMSPSTSKWKRQHHNNHHHHHQRSLSPCGKKLRLENESDEEMRIASPISEDGQKISEVLQANFGTSDWDLNNCSIAKKFWYDEEHEDKVKFFIRLHDDSGDWENSTLFNIHEQVGLSLPPTKHHLTFNEIKEKLEGIPKKRIWLDIRDFDPIFSRYTQDILGDSIESSITHFSFGRSLYSKDNEIKPNFLLEFIFEHLINLEYCSVNNGNLWKGEGRLLAPRFKSHLPKLKTLRFIHSKLRFSKSLIMTMIEMAPNLQNLYGLPFHCLADVEKLIMERKGTKSEQLNSNNNNTSPTTSSSTENEPSVVRSFYIRRDFYTQRDQGAVAYLQDLTILSRQKTWNFLEEFDTRTFFLNCKPTTRAFCVQRMSKILQRNEHSLKKLKLECANAQDLEIPRLKNLLYIQFNMNIKRREEGKKYGRKNNMKEREEISPFLPHGFNIALKFPRLASVEISVDFINSNYWHSRFCSGSSPTSFFEKYFPSTVFKSDGDSFPRVLSLRLYGFTVLECLPRMGGLFPNLKVLKLHNDLSDIAMILPTCFKLWNGLEQLYLEINMDTSRGNLDGAFCGLDKLRIGKLQRMMRSLAAVDDDDDRDIKKAIEKHKKHLSIADLPQLHTLQIILRAAASFGGDRDKLPVITKIGAFVLSRLMEDEERSPRFRVYVDFDERVTASEKKRIVATLSPILSLPLVSVEY